MARKSRRIMEIAPEIPPVVEMVFLTAVYTRLSIEDTRDGEGGSLEDQICLVKKFVSEKPYLKLVKVYSDNGQTGTNFYRPDFERLIEDVRKGLINCIVVKDLSRFARNYIEADTYIEKVFPFLGVRFISIGDNFDSFDPCDNGEGLVVALKNLMNDIYARDISQKCKTALKNKMNKGEFLGSFAPFGYAKSPENKNQLVIDEEAAAIVLDMFRWKLDGCSVSGIAKRLNALGIPAPSVYCRQKFPCKSKKPLRNTGWHDSVVKKMLCNPVYLGHMVNGMSRTCPELGYTTERVSREQWVVVENTHEPIISQQDFDAVAEMLRASTEKFYKNYGKYEYLPDTENVLKGFVYCKNCGWALKRMRNLSYNRDYVTHTYICRCCGGVQTEETGRKQIKETELLETISFVVRRQIELCADMEIIIERVGALDSNLQSQQRRETEIALHKNEISRIDNRLKALYMDKCDGLFDEMEYVRMRQSYEQSREALIARLTELTAEQEHLSAIAIANNQYTSAFRPFYGEKALTREMLTALVKRIDVTSNKQVEIIFRYKDEYEALVTAVQESKAVLTGEGKVMAG